MNRPQRSSQSIARPPGTKSQAEIDRINSAQAAQAPSADGRNGPPPDLAAVLDELATLSPQA